MMKKNPALFQLTMTEIDILAPLRFFYGAAGNDLQVTFLNPESLPELARHLLVHNGDMTSRLANHHGSVITLDAHASTRSGENLFRASVLRRQDSNAPVEYGAIRIDLTGFQPVPRQWILDSRVPLGGILTQFQIPFTSHPRGYFQLSADQYLEGLLGGTRGQTLYGRCNELRHPDGRIIADVVEILPA